MGADLVNRATRLQHLEVAALLKAYFENPDLVRVQVRETLGLSGRFAAEALGLAVFLCDGLLSLKAGPAVSEVRFFRCIERLPFELQTILCNRVYGRSRDRIPLEEREKAFKALGRVYRGNESQTIFPFPSRLLSLFELDLSPSPSPSLFFL